MSIPASEQHLFKLDWVRNPELLAAQQRVTGIRSQYTAEIAAWCAELHQQLREIARDMGLQLLLMGGNGAERLGPRSVASGGGLGFGRADPGFERISRRSRC